MSRIGQFKNIKQARIDTIDSREDFHAGDSVAVAMFLGNQFNNELSCQD